MALHSLYFGDVPLWNCSLTHCRIYVLFSYFVNRSVYVSKLCCEVAYHNMLSGCLPSKSNHGHSSRKQRKRSTVWYIGLSVSVYCYWSCGFLFCCPFALCCVWLRCGWCQSSDCVSMYIYFYLQQKVNWCRRQMQNIFYAVISVLSKLFLSVIGFIITSMFAG